MSPSSSSRIGAWNNTDRNWVGGVTYVYGFPSSTTAEYFIRPTHFHTERTKYYGIASRSLDIGDVGEAQLLFSE